MRGLPAPEAGSVALALRHRQLGSDPDLGPEAVDVGAGMAQDEPGIAIDSSIDENAGRIAERCAA
jgi:hypothetical protein